MANPFAPADDQFGLGSLRQTPTQWRARLQQSAMAPPPAQLQPAQPQRAQGLSALSQPIPSTSQPPASSAALPAYDAESQARDQQYLEQLKQLNKQDQIARNRNTNAFQDLGTRLKQGVERLPGQAAGLADVVNPLTYLTNRALVTEASDWVGEKTGFQPGKWANEAQAELTPKAQAALQQVDQAWKDGSASDIAGAYLANPLETIGGLVAESLPLMLAGGVVGRGVGMAGKALSAPGAAPAAAATGQALTKYAPAIGEGAAASGALNASLLEQGVDPSKAGLMSAGAGATTGGFGHAGRRLGEKLGFGDMDAMLAGVSSPAVTKPHGLATRLAGGAAIEGLAEELPQSVTEQMWQNAGTDRPLMEGTTRAGVEGAIAGAVMGAGFNAMPQRKPDIDGLINHALSDGTLPPGWSDPQALRQAIIDPAVDDTTRARAFAGIEERLRQRDPAFATLWREASIESLAGKRTVAETLAEIQGRLTLAQQTQQTPPATEPPADVQPPQPPLIQPVQDVQTGPSPLSDAARQGEAAGALVSDLVQGGQQSGAPLSTAGGDIVPVGTVETAGADVSAPNSQKERPLNDGEVIPLEEDPRLEDPVIQNRVLDLARASGWAEEGGRLLRDADGKARGRTNWLPNAPFWHDRPQGVTKQIVQSAISKFQSGQTMTKPERAALRFLLDTATSEDWRETEERAGDDWEAADAVRGAADVIDRAELARLEDLKERTAIQVGDDASPDAFIDAYERNIQESRAPRSPLETVAQQQAFTPTHQSVKFGNEPLYFDGTNYLDKNGDEFFGDVEPLNAPRAEAPAQSLAALSNEAAQQAASDQAGARIVGNPNAGLTDLGAQASDRLPIQLRGQNEVVTEAPATSSEQPALSPETVTTGTTGRAMGAPSGVSAVDDARAQFEPTHVTIEGVPVRGTEEPNVYVDAEGIEHEDANAEPLAPVQTPAQGAEQSQIQPLSGEQSIAQAVPPSVISGAGDSAAVAGVDPSAQQADPWADAANQSSTTTQEGAADVQASEIQSQRAPDAAMPVVEPSAPEQGATDAAPSPFVTITRQNGKTAHVRADELASGAEKLQVYSDKGLPKKGIGSKVLRSDIAQSQPTQEATNAPAVADAAQSQSAPEAAPAVPVATQANAQAAPEPVAQTGQAEAVGDTAPKTPVAQHEKESRLKQALENSNAKFKRETLKLDGGIEVTANTYKGLGVYKIGDKYYAIAHIKTGLNIVDGFSRLETAKLAAIRLANAGDMSSIESMEDVNRDDLAKFKAIGLAIRKNQANLDNIAVNPDLDLSDYTTETAPKTPPIQQGQNAEPTGETAAPETVAQPTPAVEPEPTGDSAQQQTAGIKDDNGDIRFNLANTLPATIEVDGVERPTTNSNGQPIHPTEEGVRNFWRWFGESQVVDADGKPLVVYHGTGEDFSAFSIEKAGSSTSAADAKEGFFFTTSGRDASEYAWKDGDPGSVMPAYLKIENPLISDMVVDAKNNREFAAVLKEAKKSGYDGAAAFLDTFGRESSVFVVFDPTQIKSAIGNTGDFDGSNPDIRFKTTPKRPTGDRLTRDFLQARLDAVTRAWPGLAQMPVKVVNTERALPDSVRAKLREMRANGTQAIPRAVFVPNDGLYFVAPNIGSVKEAMMALAEEAIGHHGLRAVMGPQFDALLDRVIEERQADVAAMAAEYGLDMNNTQQAREAAEEFLAHQARLDTKESWFQSLIQTFRVMLRKMGVRLRMSDGDIRALLAASNRYVQQGDARGALKARGRFGGKATERNRDVRFMFAGRKAKGADLRALTTALQRAKSGEDRETIRQETGWFQGDDGKWRFEINDDDAKFFPVTDNSVGKAWTKDLQDVIDHPALFAAYPSLRTMQIRSVQGLETNGVYRDGGIYLNASLDAAEQLSTLLHEIQHGIQRFEGFAIGGNSEQFEIETSISGASREAAIQRLEEFERQVLDGRTIYEIVEESYDLAADEEITEEEAEARIAEAKAKLDAAIQADPFIKNDFERANRPVLTAYERYHRLAGETEARNTQARQTMTAEQRRATPPSQTADVAAEDVIVMFNGKEAASAPRPANAGDPDIRFSLATPKWAENLPDTLKNAYAKLGIIHEQKTFSERAAELKENIGPRFVQAVFDPYVPMHNLPDDDHSYMLARLSRATDGIMEAMMLYGLPKMNHEGALDVDVDPSKAFLEVLKPLGIEYDRALGWVAGNRAREIKRKAEAAQRRADDLKNEIATLRHERLVAIKAGDTKVTRQIEAKISAALTERKQALERASVTERNLDDAEIQALLASAQGQMDDGRDRATVYAEFQRKFSVINRAVLDVAEAGGIIDPESRKVWESYFYVPFFRDIEAGNSGPTLGDGLLRQKGVERMRGSAEKTRDLMENTLGNWAHLLSAAAKNRAAVSALESAESIGLAVKWSPKQHRQHAAGRLKRPKDAAVVRVGGKEVTYEVLDKPFLDALSAIDYSGMQGPVAKVFRSMKRWLTIGVTSDPTFKFWRNMIRDAVTSMAVSGGLSFNPIANSVQGVKAMSGDLYPHMLAGGGLMRWGTSWEGERGKYIKRLLDQGVKASTVLDTREKVFNVLKSVWERYNEAGDRVENMQRAALYEQLIAQGKSHLEASYHSRDIMDFSNSGASAAVRMLTQTVPFLNARLQGLYKLARAGKADPRRVATVFMATTMASVALLLAYKDDEDWKRREDWDRDTYWWFKIGDTAYRIPKPFEIGALASMVERTTEFMLSDEMTDRRFAMVLGGILHDQLSMSVVPQAIKPMLDVYANKDSFTGRPIESLGMERLLKRDRHTEGTSEIARQLGKVPGGLSPVQVDHLIGGYFGWLGSMVAVATDAVARPLLDRPERPAPMLRGFTRNILEDLETDPIRSRYVTQFYDQSQRLIQAYQSMRTAQRDGDTGRVQSLQNRYGSDLKQQATRANRLRLKLAELNRERKALMSNRTIGRAEKSRRLYKLNEEMDRLAPEVGPLW